MYNVEVKLLQNPSVSIDGKAISLPFKRVEALFYYMVYHKKATRSELVDLLWEDRDETTGLKNLRQILYSLRKSTSVNMIITEGRSLLKLNPEITFDCDVDRLKKGELSFETTGEFLQGFLLKDSRNFDEWMITIRAELSRLISDQQHVAARAAISAGDYFKAESICFRMLSENSFDEEALTIQMKVYGAQKKYYEVTRIYDEFKARLEEELGVPPLKETSDTYYQIIGSWIDTTDYEDQPEFLLPCRRRQLELITEAYHSMTDTMASSHSIILRGRPGSGKSYLINQVLQNEDFSQVCLIVRNGNTSDIFDRTLKELQAFSENHGNPLPSELNERIQGLLLQTILGGETDLPAYTHVLLATVRYVTRAYRIVFVLENMHCLTANGIHLLKALMQNVSAKEFLVIAALRSRMPQYIRKGFHALVTGKYVKSIEIEFLGREDSDLYIRQLTKKFTSENIRALIFKESNGNPFLIQKIVEQLAGDDSEDDIHCAAKGAELLWLVSVSSDAFTLASLMAMFPDKVEIEQLYRLWEDQTVDLGTLLTELWIWDITIAWVENGKHYYGIRSETLRSLLLDRTPHYQRFILRKKIAGILQYDAGYMGEKTLDTDQL